MRQERMEVIRKGVKRNTLLHLQLEAHLHITPFDLGIGSGHSILDHQFWNRMSKPLHY